MKLSDLRQRLAGTNTPAGDFGLGDKVGRKPGTRLINADGTFNVVRRGHALFVPYQHLVEMSWPRFFVLALLTYLACNAIFALGFFLLGPEALTGIDPGMSSVDRFLQCFYFSVQTFTTVGYGTLAPVGVAANWLTVVLALFGWFALALVTGLFFARFSRPSRMVAFSERALIAPYKDGLQSLQFRIVNKRDSNLININARLVLTWLDQRPERGLERHFAPLELERDYVPLFPLNWTIVHPITEDSPVYDWTKEDFLQRHSELLITIEGYDRTFAQNVHFNYSYICDELEWGNRFRPMYLEREHTTELYLDRIGWTATLEEE